MKEIRSILELASPVWHSGLTKAQAAEIERVQKIALWIIQGNSKESYENRLEELEIERLSTRRQKLCVKFASKAVKSRHSEMFPKRDATGYNTRQVFGPYFESRSNTNRCYNSPLNFLTRLLNENFLRN